MQTIQTKLTNKIVALVLRVFAIYQFQVLISINYNLSIVNFNLLFHKRNIKT